MSELLLNHSFVGDNPSSLSGISFESRSSVLGNKWQLSEHPARDIDSLRQQFGLSSMTAKVLLNRGITLEQAEAFLKPSLRYSLPDPFHLLDMQLAVDAVMEAIDQGKKIAVFGDYDVDGATSSALLSRFFEAIGHTVTIYIPDRMKEGYGPNKEAFSTLRKKGIDSVITVDCGALAFEPLAHAKAIGLDVIVMDHHLGAEQLPEARAVVNPNRLDENTEYRYLAAVGVCYLFIIALNKTLRDKGYYQTSITEPDLLSLLDIVALGTVCDVMPLTGLNRTFVKQGLKIMARRANTGIRALADTAAIQESFSSYHLGFVLGPRINAGGRVGKADMGSRLLTTNQDQEARELAHFLSMYNDERKAIEQSVLEESIAMVELQPDPVNACVMVAGEGWHQGVIGIIASRLKERYDRPSVVLSIENTIAKASARSVSGVDMGACVLEAKRQGLIKEGGGHAMAAGFSVEVEKLEALQDFFNKNFQEAVARYHANKTLSIDALVAPSGINVALVKELEQLAPYGVGNPSPKLVLANCQILQCSVVAEKHIRCIVGASKRAGSGHQGLKAMAFRSVDTELGQALLSLRSRTVHIAGQARINHWQGNDSAEFTIDDVMLA